jgi:hypothetical protein
VEVEVEVEAEVRHTHRPAVVEEAHSRHLGAECILQGEVVRIPRSAG